MNPTTILTASGPLQRIGFGNCGSVWATLTSQTGQHVVIKREDASPGRDIKNEVSVQSQVYSCAGTLKRTSVPECFELMDAEDERWRQLLPLLPDGFQPCRAMIAEKIKPVSLQAQLLLVDTYIPEAHREELRKPLHSGQGAHCLVRIYLGRRRQMTPNQQRRRHFFSLRNFLIHVDQAEELGLPCEEYAKAMGEAFATLNWLARTNGNDVEFVLGASRNEDEGAAKPLANHAMWMLDYDCSRAVEANDEGLESIARSFWRNDPFYPRPGAACARDRRLWDVFAAEYRRVGVGIVRENASEGEDVDVLCELVEGALVEGALVRIVETKGKWTRGAHF